jgi:hypothetical protein
MTLPDFLMIGAQKSGTSAIYAYLSQHPQVFTSENKEPGFFAFEGLQRSFAGPDDARAGRDIVRDLERYRRLFREVGDKARAGEASSIYLYAPQAAERIHHYIPNAKLIAVLRDPVDRAYSAYRHLVRDGRESLSFEGGLPPSRAGRPRTGTRSSTTSSADSTTHSCGVSSSSSVESRWPCIPTTSSRRTPEPF